MTCPNCNCTNCKMATCGSCGASYWKWGYPHVCQKKPDLSPNEEIRKNYIEGARRRELGLTTVGKKVIDYDGVFELPLEAIQLLNEYGLDTDEVK